MFTQSGFISKPPPGSQINPAHPLARGLVFCTLFNEGAGIPRDISGYGAVDVTRNGTTLWQGQGLYQDGSTWANNVDFGNPKKLQFTQADSFSAHCIVTVAGNAGTYRNILRYDNASGPRKIFCLRMQNSNIPEFFFGDLAAGVGYVPGIGTVNVDTSKPRHFTAVRDAGRDKCSLFVDGILDNETTDGSLGTWTLDNSTWRTKYDFDEPWNGDLLTYFIYNRALSPAEAQQLYLNPWQMFRAVSPRIMRHAGIPPGVVPITSTAALTNSAVTMAASVSIINPISATAAVTNSVATMTAAITVTNPAAASGGSLMLLGIG